MTNPLIDKFYELHPEKKEKPKKVEFEGTVKLSGYVKLSEEQMDIVSKYLTTPDKYSTTNTQSTITTTNLTSSGNGITAITASNTAANPYTAYYGNSSNYSSNNEFFKVADKIQKGNARVVSIVVNREILGKTSVKFEVVMDT